MFYVKRARRKYAYVDRQSKAPIKCWLSPNYCGTVCKTNCKKNLIFPAHEKWFRLKPTVGEGDIWTRAYFKISQRLNLERRTLLWQRQLQIWPVSGDTACVSGVIACVHFTRRLRSCGGVTAAAALGSRRYRPSLQSLLANSCFILWQFALMKSRRSPSDLCSLSIFNHVILIWGMS